MIGGKLWQTNTHFWFEGVKIQIDVGYTSEKNTEMFN